MSWRSTCSAEQGQAVPPDNTCGLQSPEHSCEFAFICGFFFAKVPAMSSPSLPDPTFRPLASEEVSILIEWAAEEGWNPGLGDAEAFWAADPEAFWGMEIDGELVGGGAIPAYEGRLGFMGLFIIRPEWRGRGLGRKLWYFRRDRLKSRLQEGAPISMDGVFNMQPFYASGGFGFTHRNLRMQGIGQLAERDPHLVQLTELPFDAVETFDEAHFGARRTAFLRRWIDPAGGLGLGFVDQGALKGMGVIRPCREGFKIGPLFSANPEVADRLYSALAGFAEGKTVYLDIPEVNAEASALARRYGMSEVFGCARMVLGTPPALPWNSIYGVTTFEMG
jgi:GNAT superfamily N-acetyltransferase